MWPTLFELPFLHWPIRSYGFMLMIGFLGGTWWATRRAVRVKCDPDFVINLGFLALVASVVGSRIFYVVHYWDEHFAGRGLWAVIDITQGGLEFYGGFIGAMLAILVYMKLSKVSIRLYLDIITPSLMFGMAMARIGCFLNGCCWGGPCTASLPWAVRFPYASPALCREWEDRQVTLPAELIYVHADGRAEPLPRDLLRMSPEERSKRTTVSTQLDHQLNEYHMTVTELADLAHEQGRSLPVHPVQVYASLNGLLLAMLLNEIFYRRKRHGMVFALMLMLYPAARIMEEIIRIDNPHDTAGLTISQFVSVLLLLTGVALFYAFKKMPERSPLAVPFVPPVEPPPKKKGKR
jgi:phosphatidylglycerol---prolipoprotein diacylglyceryl transferase